MLDMAGEVVGQLESSVSPPMGRKVLNRVAVTYFEFNRPEEFS